MVWNILFGYVTKKKKNQRPNDFTITIKTHLITTKKHAIRNRKIRFQKADIGF